MFTMDLVEHEHNFQNKLLNTYPNILLLLNVTFGNFYPDYITRALFLFWWENSWIYKIKNTYRFPEMYNFNLSFGIKSVKLHFYWKKLIWKPLIFGFFNLHCLDLCKRNSVLSSYYSLKKHITEKKTSSSVIKLPFRNSPDFFQFKFNQSCQA